MSGTQSSGVVTPEAVVLQFDTAGLGSRVAAQIIDIIIRVALIIAFALIAEVLDNAGGPAWLAVTIATFGIFTTTFLYSTIWETLWDGRTPGKAAFGLRVVTVEGGPIRFRHAAIRGALAVFEVVLTNGAVAAISIVVSERNQRLGDIVAGTLVLRERKATQTPVATSFIPPPGTEEFALSLDVSSLTADEYITVRSFLLRAAGLEQGARQTLSDQLGRQFAARLRANPPNWMPSEIFLVCVAAAYQRRFALRG